MKVSPSPHFSSPVYYGAAIIRPGCVSLGRPHRRNVKVRLRWPRSQALPGRRLGRLATTGGEESRLGVCAVEMIVARKRQISFYRADS